MLRATCPNRFLEGRLIFPWIGDVLLGSPTPRVVGEVGFLESERIEEGATEGDDVGRIDHVLVHPSADPMRWCALEIQAVYFSGASMGAEFIMLRHHNGTSMPFPAGHRRPGLSRQRTKAAHAAVADQGSEPAPLGQEDGCCRGRRLFWRAWEGRVMSTMSRIAISHGSSLDTMTITVFLRNKLEVREAHISEWELAGTPARPIPKRMRMTKRCDDTSWLNKESHCDR